MQDPSSLRPDPLTVRAAYAALARQVDVDDFLSVEIGRRMIERLEIMRIDPARLIVDVGSGRGHDLAALHRRFPQACVLALDFAEEQLKGSVATAAGLSAGWAPRWLKSGWRRWQSGGASRGQGEAPLAVAADAAALPLADASVDLVWSSLSAHWFADPAQVVREWGRVLRPEGLLMFSALGPDAFRESRAAGLPIPQWPDMHDWGDLLVGAGFADPVMDAERLELTWQQTAARNRDLATLLPPVGVPIGLEPPPEGASWADSVEIVYGHAWSPAHKRRTDGLVPISFARRPSRGTK